MRFKYLQHHAHLMTRLAIKHGDLVPAERCECCLSVSSVEAHHPDYSKPLEVVWVCRSCHRAFHNTPEENSKRHPFGKRKKISEVARQIHENGDADRSAADLMEKYGISLGSTSKVRSILKNQNGNSHT